MKFIDVLMAISIAVIWGMGFVVAKAGMDHFSPILLMALRFTLTSICLIWFFCPSLDLLKRLFWIALISASIQYSLTFTGVKGIDASTSALLIQLEVPFGLITAWLFLGEKISLKQMLGMFIAFAGAVLIVGEPKLSNDLTSVALLIAGAFTWAVGQVMIKKLSVEGGFVLITGIAIWATPQLFISSFLLESNQIEQLTTAPIEAWLAVAYLGLVMTALAYAMWYRLLNIYSVNKVMPFLLLLPLTSVVGGIFFLNESLTLKITLGGILTLIGVAVITVRFKRESDQPRR